MTRILLINICVRYINVRVTGRFKCHLCKKKFWTSHFAWILFDMKNRHARRMSALVYIFNRS